MQIPSIDGLGLPVYSPDVGEDKAIPLIRLQSNSIQLF